MAMNIYLPTTGSHRACHVDYQRSDLAGFDFRDPAAQLRNGAGLFHPGDVMSVCLMPYLDRPLQRSRGCFTPETSRPCGSRPIGGVLQRSRGCFTPETRARDNNPVRLRRASTEPGLFHPGDLITGALLDAHIDASTEPGLFHPGDPVERAPQSVFAGHQASTEPGLFHPGDQRVVLLVVAPLPASTEPGLFHPGDRIKKPGGKASMYALQRSRGCFTPETRQYECTRDSTLRRFNGAGVVSPRRPAVPTPADYGGEMLQRSRGCFTPETRRRRRGARLSGHASTEPGLFHPGDRPLRLTTCRRISRFNEAGVVSPRRPCPRPR